MSGLWYTEEFEGRLQVGLKVKETLFSGKSEFQTVEIVDTELYGKTLAIDGLFMTSVGDEYYYHELIVHPALCTAPKIENVLIVGGGDGGTAREVLRHPEVKKATVVEIDAMVVEASKQHLPEIGSAWDDPRLEVIIGDGIDFVRRAEPSSYDVVLLDGSDPVGPAEGLFGTAFYQDVSRSLTPSGVFALQSESPLLFEKVFVEIQHSLKGVFEQVHPYFNPVPIYGTGLWSWTYVSQLTKPSNFNKERFAAIKDGCKLYTEQLHHGVFSVPPIIQKKIDNED